MLIGQCHGPVPFGAMDSSLHGISFVYGAVTGHHVDHAVSAPPSLRLHRSIKRHQTSSLFPPRASVKQGQGGNVGELHLR